MRRGELVADRFEIEELIGSGGMGSIHKAKDRLTGEFVALKTMRGAKFGPRFVREARVLAELSHPAVVRYIAHGPLPTGEPFLAMEWLSGEDLSHRLQRAALSPAESVAMGVRVAGALGAAHKARIIHRDVKPGNIFLVGGDVTRAKLIDFGIAHMMDATFIATQKGAIVGTPGYMAPEQAKGIAGIDARADVFSLGCVLYRCLSGRAPFEGDDLIAILAKLVLDTPARVRELGVDIPAPLDDLVAEMLSKRPDERPADGAAAAAALAVIDFHAETLGGLFGMDPAMNESITGAERRLVSVVVMAPDTRDKAALAADGPTTLVTDERIIGAVDTFGAQVVSLADGSLLATLRGDGEPTDQAAKAARYALALRVAFPARAMVLATGHHVLGDRIPISEVVDRAAAIVGRASASATEAASAEVRVRLDEVTAGLLSHRFEIGGDAVSLFLLREREPFESTPRTLLGAPIALIGRERELATLESIYEECVGAKEAAAVVVTAPAGVGKSRLGSEFLIRVEQGDDPVEIWIARGDSVGAGAPFRMLGQVIRCAARILDGEPLPVRRQKLRARVARRLAEPDVPRVAEFLGELCGAPFPDEGRVSLLSARRDPTQMGDEMRRAFEDFLAAECESAPVVIVLEDLHWGDLPSVQWIDAALRNLHDKALFILALCRPEIVETFPGLWGERRKHELRLVELSRRASERMVREALGNAARPEVIARILARAAGNAFYLEELIRAVAEGRGDELPETVLAMVEVRLGALPAEARRVLRAASVFGHTFWKGGVTALLGGSRTAEGRATLVGTRAIGATEWLDELSRREMITRRQEGRFPEEEEYVFRHALVRDAAYAMLTEEDQRLGHRLAAAWLSGAGEADAAVLAEHLERAGEPGRAVGSYLRAAEQALEGNDFAAALRHGKRGVMCGAAGEIKGELLLVQAEANKGIGHNVDVEACSAEAVELLPRQSPKWFLAVADLAFASSKVGNEERLLQLSHELIRIDGRGAPDTYAIAAARLAAHLIIAGHGDAGERLLSAAEAAMVGEAEPDAMTSAFIARARGFRAMLAGDIPGFLAAMLDAASGFERAGALRSLIIAQGNIGYAYLELGAFSEAEQALRDALAKAERMGLSEPSAGVRQNLALALARKGELVEARSVVGAALKAAISHSSRRLEGVSRIYLARILGLSGDPSGAEREARAAASLPALSASLRAYALGVLAAALLALGRPEEALSVTEEASTKLTSSDQIEEGEAVVNLSHVEALFANHRAKEAREALISARTRLLSRADRIGDPAWRDSFLTRVPDNARILELARAFADAPPERS